MPFDKATRERLENVFQNEHPFNDPFNISVRSLNFCYHTRMNFVLTGGLVLNHCQNCYLSPLEKEKARLDTLTDESQKEEDVHCCLCRFPLDVKYMTPWHLEIYTEMRPLVSKLMDFNAHQENKKVYEILNPEIVSSPQTQNIVEIITQQVVTV